MEVSLFTPWSWRTIKGQYDKQSNKNGNESPETLLNQEMNCAMEAANLSNLKVVSPQGIQLNGNGPAIFREQSSCFSVQVPVGFLKNWKERKDTDSVRVWLLRADGTQVPQSAEPFVFSIGTFGEHAKDYQFYTFPKVPEDELASVIISYNGRLYCHEIRKVGELDPATSGTISSRIE